MTDPTLPELPPKGYGGDAWTDDVMLAWGLQCYRAGLAAHHAAREASLIEALQEIARWTGNQRVQWYVDQYAASPSTPG